jgi:hypothetical protein
MRPAFTPALVILFRFPPLSGVSGYSCGVGLGFGFSDGGLSPLEVLVLDEEELLLESSPEGEESRFLSLGGPSLVVAAPPESEPRTLVSSLPTSPG